MRSLALVVLLGCGGVPPAPSGALVLTRYAPVDLPAGVEALLADAERAAASGPAGADLERGLAAAQRILAIEPHHDRATAVALRTFHYLAAGAGDAAEGVARRCQPLASRAAADPGAGPASHLFAAICLGHFAKATDSADLVTEFIRLAEAARAADPTLDHAGPDRVLGALYLRAPAWPVSVGDIERATEHLETAARLAPRWPENHLLLAEALAFDGRDDEAEAALLTARALLEDPRHAGWRAVWSRMADAL